MTHLKNSLRKKKKLAERITPHQTIPDVGEFVSSLEQISRTEESNIMTYGLVF